MVIQLSGGNPLELLAVRMSTIQLHMHKTDVNNAHLFLITSSNVYPTHTKDLIEAFIASQSLCEN